MREIVPTNPQPAASVVVERRRSRRVPVSMEVIWEGMSGRFESRVCDLSLDGCFIESLADVRPGYYLSFRLKLPTGNWLFLHGQVAYCHPPVGFGVLFDEIPLTTRSMLNALMRFYS